MVASPQEKWMVHPETGQKRREKKIMGIIQGSLYCNSPTISYGNYKYHAPRSIVNQLTPSLDSYSISGDILLLRRLARNAFKNCQLYGDKILT